MTFRSSPLSRSLLLLLVFCTLQKWTTAAPIDSGLELILLHNNDMHARFEQTGALGNQCNEVEAASNRCYGGFSRVMHEVRKYREAANQTGGTPVIYLNAGDTYTGSTWFYIYKYNITADFMNILQPDASSFGNHEFDDGVDGVLPFLAKVNFPVLVANIDLTKTPKLKAMKNVQPSTILDVKGTKIGVIGYLTNETVQLSLTDELSFSPEIDAINAEAEKLRDQGVKIIIALGHSGYMIDQMIALYCPLVDLVVGGHSHTFLYSGTPPDTERPEGPYPTVVSQPSGKQVPVVQAYAFTKYLGKLTLKFDNDGNLLEWNGEPILLNASVPQDVETVGLLEKYRKGVEAAEQTVVGHTKVLLDGDQKVCRERECNFGNMIADAFIYARMLEYMTEADDFWSDAAIAFMQGGGIRSSIPKTETGEITLNDLMVAMPYSNKLLKVEVTGKTIRNMLETSVSKLGYGFGGFLQMSGVHTVIDADAPVNSRVKSVRVLCAKCNIPKYSDLDDEKTYGIITTDYLLGGGDGFSIPTLSAKQLEVDDLGAVQKYIKAKSPVYPGVDWRIRIQGTVVTTTPSLTTTSSPTTTSSFTTTPTITTTEGDGASHIAASGLLIFLTLLLQYLH